MTPAQKGAAAANAQHAAATSHRIPVEVFERDGRRPIRVGTYVEVRRLKQIIDGKVVDVYRESADGPVLLEVNGTVRSRAGSERPSATYTVLGENAQWKKPIRRDET